MNSLTADVTVVIPAKNRAHRLTFALESIRAQTVQPSEVIVIDDGSSDDTSRVATEFGVTVLRNETSTGAGEARNRGIMAASTKWVAFLDSDDVWLPGHLEESLSSIGSRVFVTSPMRDSFGRVRGNVSRHSVPVSYRRLFFPENVVCTSTVVARRDALVAAGGFVHLDRAEDLDLWIRMLGRGAALALPVPSATYFTESAYVDPELAQRNTVGTQSVMDRYAGQTWLTRRIRRLVAGQRRWDEFRHAVRRGRRPNLGPLSTLAGDILYLPESLLGTMRHRYRARNYDLTARPLGLRTR